MTIPEHPSAEASPRVILIDDDKDFLDAQVQALELAGFAVHAFLNGAEAIRHITRDFEGVIVSDVRMPNMDGLSLFKRVRELDPELPVLLLTGHGDVPMAVQALKDGVYDFLIKPFSVAELIASLGRASQKRELILENRHLRKLHASHLNAKTALVGESAVMDALRQTLSQVAEADVDVLITGEGGVGKKTVARSLHSLSHRKAKPFVQINCATLSEDRFYAEVFGSVPEEAPNQRFAPKRVIGLFERAHRGSILFDDVGALSLQQQAALLRVVETRECLPRGAAAPSPLDLRIVATSRENLIDSVHKGTFRGDLFYLLSSVTLHVPPLSERRADIRLLFQHFLFAACVRTKRPVPRLTLRALMHLQRHDWPGNVRELERFAERFALGLEPEDDDSFSGDGASSGLAERVNQFEAELIQQVLSRCQGDAKRSMDALKLPRKTFYDKLTRHGIRIADYR